MRFDDSYIDGWNTAITQILQIIRLTCPNCKNMDAIEDLRK